MVREIIQSARLIQTKESPRLPIKYQSSSIHKSLTSKKTAITAQDMALNLHKQQHKAVAVPVIQRQQPLAINTVIAQTPQPMVTTVPAYYNGNIIQLLPQVSYPQPVQYQVLVPIEPTPVTFQKSQAQNELTPVPVHDHKQTLSGCNQKSCSGDVSSSDLKKSSSKGILTAQSNSGMISAARTTAASNISLSEPSESPELEIEIPGGFDNIQSFENDMSCSHTDDSEYVTLPKLEKWIGLDWDEVSITSDVSQNFKDYFKGVRESNLACRVCCKKFRNQEELLAHELSHESENPFKCPHMFCTSRYDKACQLKSHMRKRHAKHWPKFEQALLKSMENEGLNEIACLLQPSDSMLEAIDPSIQI